MPWNDIAIAETVTMIPEDAAVTTVTLDGSPLSVATHRSSTIADDHGSRACTMVFTGDNKAYAQVDGKEIELKTFNVRATEFDTPASMPAKLPPNSAYTYCVDMAVDGAESIRFAQPIVTYVDNFLGFPVGMRVPVGYYDYKKAIWIPEDNGVVVRLLDANADGEVDSLDATGDGLPDDLNTDGTLSDEVEGLNNSEAVCSGSNLLAGQDKPSDPR